MSSKKWGFVLNDLEVDPARYSLVFEGVSDDNPETLQKLKGVFIADLDLSVPEVQAILDFGKGVVCSSDDEAELKQKFLLLQKAGANVHIVVPQGLSDIEFAVEELGDEVRAAEMQLELNPGDEPAIADDAYELEDTEEFAYAMDGTDQYDETFAEEDDLEVLKTAAGENAEQDFVGDEDDEEEEGEGDDFELELSFDEMFEPAKPEPKKKRTTVHVINDESLSLDDTLSELGIEPGESVPPTAAQPGAGGVSPAADIAGPSLDLNAPVASEMLSSTAGMSDFAAPAVPDTSALSFDDPTAAKPSEPGSAETPRVNDRGIIPDTAIGDLPLFELGSMDEEVRETKPSAAPLEAPAAADADSLFADLTLAEPVESDALLEPGVNDNSLAEDFDLSLGKDSVDAKQPEVKLSTPPEPVQKKAPAAPEKKKPVDTPTGGGLFSGLDLDSVLDSVVDSASADLKKAGIEAEVEIEEHKPVATSQISLADTEPEADANLRKVARPEIEGEHEQEPLVVSNTDPELRTRKKNSLSLKRGTAAKQEASEAAIVPARSKSRLPVDVVLVVVIGIAVLGIGNWLYFKGSIEANELEQNRIQMELAKVRKEEKLRAKRLEEEQQIANGSAPAKKIKYTSEYVGRFTDNGLQVNARVRIESGEVEIIEFSIRTPEPRELTDMEIVEKKQKLPWLAKVAVDPVLLPLNSEGSLSENVTVKSFIEDNFHHTRLLADGVLNATHYPEEHRLEISLQVRAGNAAVKPFNEFSIERVEASSYRYAASGKVMLQAVPAKEP